MDEITQTFSKKIKLDDLKDIPHKKWKLPDFGGNHKPLMIGIAVAIFGFFAITMYVNKKIDSAIAAYDAGKTAPTTDHLQVDNKISTAINNYNTQIQPRFVDLETKVEVLQHPPTPAVAAPAPIAPVPVTKLPAKKAAPVKNTKATKPLKTAKVTTTKRTPATKAKTIKKK